MFRRPDPWKVHVQEDNARLTHDGGSPLQYRYDSKVDADTAGKDSLLPDEDYRHGATQADVYCVRRVCFSSISLPQA